MRSQMAKEHQVQVHGLAPQVPARQVLGEGTWQQVDGVYIATLSCTAAARVRVQLSGVVLLGRSLQVQIEPSLRRGDLRAAQTQKAKELREQPAGFSQQNTQMDEQGRYSLTPEGLAMAMAQKNTCAKVLDLGCGVGGNAIAFARHGAKVQALELDPTRARMARHNARIYGVTDRITVRCEDALAALPQRFAGLVFCDPPWGRDWKQHPSELSRYPLAKALWAARTGFDALWLKLPPAFDPRSLGPLEGTQLRMQFYFGKPNPGAQAPKFLVLRATTL